MSEALRQVVWKCDRCGGDAQAIFGIFPSCKCGSTSFKAAQPPAPTAQPAREDLIAALHFYASGEHFNLSDPTAWDTVSGEPQNWQCDEAGTATVEDGSIAKMTLAGKLTAAQIEAIEDGEAFDAQPQAAQPGAEPVAEVRSGHEGFGLALLGDLPPDGTRLYTQAAPAQRQPLTVPALTDAQMSECAWGYVADSRNLDAGVTGIIQATQLACAAAWGVTLAQKGEKL